MLKLNVVFKLIRPLNSIISSTISAFLFYKIENNLAGSIWVWISIFFTITFGFAINDFFDHEKDKIYPEKHVIAAGLLSRKHVFFLSLLLFFFGFISSFFLSDFRQSIIIILLIVLAIYSYINNNYGVLANVLVGFCSSLSILIAMDNFISSSISISSICVFFFIIGREIIKDIHDVDADRVIRKSSLPINFDNNFAFYVSVFCTFLSLSIALIYGFISNDFNFMFFMIIAHIVYLIFAFIYFMSNYQESKYNSYSLASKLSFLILLPALLI
ncbi:UbiA family prenyltransferase [Zobellia nedashkovskayae]|uniref:UbiA family prenyltransferase n=1 Tax=Zobellia nedashkovskayae TaxID=2779510 RepID=UPI00188BDE0C|nr:UbiA family prenyltransferase [Zobellia nedashkovskayae]